VSIEGYDREVERDCDCVTFGDPTKLRALAEAVDEYDKAVDKERKLAASYSVGALPPARGWLDVMAACKVSISANEAVISAARALVQEPKP